MIGSIITFQIYSTRNVSNIRHFEFNHSFIKNTCFPWVIIESNKLHPEIQNVPGLKIFKNDIFKFLRPTTNNMFSCHNLIVLNI